MGRAGTLRARQRAHGGVAIAAAVILGLPAAATAGQSSQATAAPFAQVATGIHHTCAVLTDATLRCWGFSGDGQAGYGNTSTIGDDETPASAGPVNLGAGRTVRALAAGDYHTCAVLDDGSVRCWGYAFDGQLGYGNRNRIGDTETPDSAGAVEIGGTATAIAAGNRHTCALLAGGTVRCWGLGEAGQLGAGQLGNAARVAIGDTETPTSVNPVDFGSGHTAKAITAGGGHSCAILEDNTVRCWGSNTNGQLGYADTSAVLSPSTVGSVNLGGGRTAKAISAGDTHTCAVLDDHSIRCWGLNDVGQLGTGDTTSIGDDEPPGSVAPVDLGGRTATAISAGGNQLLSEGHTCAVLDNGTVRCWGAGVSGKLGYAAVGNVGDNESPGSVGPVDLGAGRTATAISAGGRHTCVRLSDPGLSVQCWGNGADGRLGHCDVRTIGDDETPASIGLVDIGAGGAACPVVPPPAVAAPVTAEPAAVTPAAPAAPAVTPSFTPTAAQLRAEQARAQGLRGCRSGLVAKLRAERSRALRRYRAGTRPRALALRSAARRAARARARCAARFGRTPGPVRFVAATVASSGKVVLTFRSAGSDGSKPPAARGYVVKQSRKPIRTAADFGRAPALCGGTCRFDITDVMAKITLKVKQLRPDTTYYYAIAARDNVSGRIGPRSRTVIVKKR